MLKTTIYFGIGVINPAYDILCICLLKLRFNTLNFKNKSLLRLVLCLFTFMNQNNIFVISQLLILLQEQFWVAC